MVLHKNMNFCRAMAVGAGASVAPFVVLHAFDCCAFRAGHGKDCRDRGREGQALGSS